MPLRFPEKNMVPPGGWKYLQRETNALIGGGHWGELLSNIVAHRQANNLPIGAAFEDAVEFDICESLRAEGINWCVEQNKGLGDAAYDALHRVAIIVDSVAGTNIKECGGCKARRDMLNNISRFN